MTLNEQKIENLLSGIKRSINEVYTHDSYLIKNKVHERTIVGRFAIYFQKRLNQMGYSNFNLDIEYNKDHSNPKRTKNFSRGTYPDVVVHKRGSNEHNLCLIEFKTWWDNYIDKDIAKLKDFTDEKDKYKYGIGFSIILNRDTPYIQAVEKGRILNITQENEVFE